MTEQYEPTEAEKKLMVRFTMDRTMHLWDTKDKVVYLAYLNKRAGLPFGTIGLLHTEYEDWKTKQKIITEVPYASRQTTVELAKKENISLKKVDCEITQLEAIYCFKAVGPANSAGDGERREVEATGVCSLVSRTGNPLDATMRANKIMHAETKAKRRATLEYTGLAFIDESEIDTIEGAKVVELDEKTGEVKVDVPKTSTPVTPAESAATVPATTKKGNGQTLPTTPTAAQAAESPAPSADATTPAPSVPTPPISSPSSPTEPIFPEGTPARFQLPELLPLFLGEDTTVVWDADHVNFIQAQGKECGWLEKPAGESVSILTKWLAEGFDVSKATSSNLTLGVFKKIVAGIDMALTAAGR